MRIPWISVAVLVIAAGVAPSQAYEPRHLILCEGKDKDIKCPDHEVIEIIHANYGRTSSNVCDHSKISNTSCTDSSHTRRLRDECNGKRKCRVWARNSFWGDTCRGTYKYLEVDYLCGNGDECPNDPYKTEPGQCGCGYPDDDSDDDGTADCNDDCPHDSDKTEPGICGCGYPDVDSDYDGTPDCNDECPNDPRKTKRGVCGCDYPDNDYDDDGTPDCRDECPYDPEKTEPGVCGCGYPDTDSDYDGTPDCIDGCPLDPEKTERGLCDCGQRKCKRFEWCNWWPCGKRCRPYAECYDYDHHY